MEHRNHTPHQSFSYTYSPSREDELLKIRKKYTADETEAKWARLQALDASVTGRAQLVALIIGILSALVLGLGMCCVLVWGTNTAMIILGVFVGLIGIIGIAVAYPVYLSIMRRRRDRVAPEILRLTEELMNK
ncbi:MAG: hypothetical protein E7639_02690 [Ruminococcaceae bacterium]|nr:hypothetical protein [Oscillospiraceae bacterium]